jgi:hypothetical protein
MELILLNIEYHNNANVKFLSILLMMERKNQLEVINLFQVSLIKAIQKQQTNLTDQLCKIIFKIKLMIFLNSLIQQNKTFKLEINQFLKMLMHF